MKRRVLIGMGSNIEPERHLCVVARTIRKRFPDAVFSRVYRSAAIGMGVAADFLNACCLINTTMRSVPLNAWLKQMEDTHGRDRSKGLWTPRALDLDVLMIGDEVVDEDLCRYAHACVPAAELVELSLPLKVVGKLHSTSIRL